MLIDLIQILGVNMLILSSFIENKMIFLRKKSKFGPKLC